MHKKWFYNRLGRPRESHTISAGNLIAFYVLAHLRYHDNRLEIWLGVNRLSTF